MIYIIAQRIPSRDHTGLKIILPVDGAQYIFTDSAEGDIMRRTGIHIHKNMKSERFLNDEDVQRFLRSELDIKNLQISSYWTA